MNDSDYKSRNKNNKKIYKSLFITTEDINAPLSKEYNIFHYISPKIKNENRIFDLIHLLGNRKDFQLQKEIYETEKRKIHKKIITHKDDRLKKINLNAVNVNIFDKNKMDMDLPQLTLEEFFMVEMIKYFNNKKKLNEKKEEEKKVKLLNIKSLSQDDLLSKFSTENTNKYYIRTKRNKNIFNNKNLLINNNKSPIFSNHTVNANISTKFNSNNILKNDNESSLTPTSKNINNIPLYTVKSFYSNNHTNLNKNKKSFSYNNFLDNIKQLNLDFKNNLSSPNKLSDNLNLKENNNTELSNNNKNTIKKMKLNKNKEDDKIFKELYYNFFNEEKLIINKTNEINDNLLDFKYNKYVNKVNIYNNVIEYKYKKNKYKSFINKSNKQKKNKYKKIAENLNRYKKGLYDFPEVNKYIYGSKNPLKVFGASKIKPFQLKNNNLSK